MLPAVKIVPGCHIALIETVLRSSAFLPCDSSRTEWSELSLPVHRARLAARKPCRTTNQLLLEAAQRLLRAPAPTQTSCPTPSAGYRYIVPQAATGRVFFGLNARAARRHDQGSLPAFSACASAGHPPGDTASQTALCRSSRQIFDKIWHTPSCTKVERRK